MPDHHLAQLNIARLLAPLDSPQLADFVANEAFTFKKPFPAPGYDVAMSVRQLVPNSARLSEPRSHGLSASPERCQ